MGQKVLLADDSITVQKIVKLSLTEEGIEVIALGNGEQAVQQLETLRPDLVMADVFMPGKDGYEVCEFVKAHPQLKHIPVILLVHAFEPFDPERAKKVGADHQLTKPFQSIRTLVTTVQDLLQAAVEPATQKMEPVSATPEPPAASVSFSPMAYPLEEEYAVVSSLTSAASAEPEAALGGVTLSGFAVAPVPTAPTSFAPTTPFPLTETSLPVPGASNLLNVDLLPPSELSVFPQTDWPTARQAPSEPLPMAAFSPSLAPVSLTTKLELADQAAEDVLELTDVLALDFGGTEPMLDTPRVHHFATDTPLLAVLGTSPATTNEVVAAHLPLADSANPSFSPSFRESFDVAVGQIDLQADAVESISPAQEVKTGLAASQATPAALQIPEAVIEEIVNRVVRQLSTKAIQEVAWEVVPEMAELLIRKQISQHQPLTH
jgi:CheY-like chemotaxis protein